MFDMFWNMMKMNFARFDLELALKWNTYLIDATDNPRNDLIICILASLFAFAGFIITDSILSYLLFLVAVICLLMATAAFLKMKKRYTEEAKHDMGNIGV
jgi:hypothetical protein